MPTPNHALRPKTAPLIDRREVFDAREACHLVNQGWTLLELVTVSRWSSGYHSESTTYTVGLPRPQPSAKS